MNILFVVLSWVEKRHTKQNSKYPLNTVNKRNLVTSKNKNKIKKTKITQTNCRTTKEHKAIRNQYYLPAIITRKPQTNRRNHDEGQTCGACCGMYISMKFSISNRNHTLNSIGISTFSFLSMYFDKLFHYFINRNCILCDLRAV